MSKFNLQNQNSATQNYQDGLLPQRNSKDLWYQDSSSRSSLQGASFNSENRRIIKKTQNFSYQIFNKDTLNYTPQLQKTIKDWIKGLQWDFPISSVKKIFKDHIFNTFYFWYDDNKDLVAVSICYFNQEISHISYVFYDPKYSHQNLPIRIVLQVIEDSINQNLNYCYLGRFSESMGFYKRNMPNFQIFKDNSWQPYQKDTTTHTTDSNNPKGELTSIPDLSSKALNIHILGIAGMLTAPLAVELKRLGHHLTGSDQDKIYPPVSTILSDANIDINPQIDYSQIDLFIVGSSFKAFEKCRQEYQMIEQKHYPYISASKFIGDFLKSPSPILVAGAYGKTTISALLTKIFLDQNIPLSYLFAGLSLNDIPSLKTHPQPNFSIIEADESINGLDTKAKFHYYPIKHLILTSARWEHFDSYQSREDNLNSFKELLQRMPQDGILVYNPSDPDIQAILPFCSARKVPYQVDNNYPSNLIGEYNQQNAAAATTMSLELKLDPEKIKSSLLDFKSISRRLQLISQSQNFIFIDDFAQSAQRVKEALKALSQNYPEHLIYTYFEPQASFLQDPSSLPAFSEAFQVSKAVALGKIRFSKDSTHPRISFSDYQTIIGDKLSYTPLEEQVTNFFKDISQKALENKQKIIFIHFSSGGLDGIKLFTKLATDITQSDS